jgi:hypothetical protein
VALLLNATVGSPTANSYLTREEADTYFETRLYSSAWTQAAAGLRDAALTWATRLLDRAITWNGAISSLTQSLRWPRTGALTLDGQLYIADVIPAELKEATAELALYLLRRDRTADTGREGIKSFEVGSLAFEFDKTTDAPLIPDAVLQLIAHLGTLNVVGTRFGGITAVPLIRT